MRWLVNSWVGDHQEILTVVCFHFVCFSFLFIVPPLGFVLQHS